MKFEKVGKEVEVPKVTVPPLALAESDVFNILDLLLGKIKKEKPEIFQLFIDEVTKKLKSKTQNKEFEGKEKLAEKLKEFDHLPENHDFVKLHLNFMIEGLGITEEELWENQKTSFPIESFIPALIEQTHLQMITLIEILGRETAIKFHREFVNKYNETINARHQANIHENLEEMRKGHMEWIKTNPYGRIRIFGEVKDGQLIRLCSNCEKYYSLRNHEMVRDRETIYSLLCYMHIPLARVWNPNFVLTIEKSLARGDPYCAYIYNDMRKREDANPPSEEYLDELWKKYK